ncbi:MAG: hypothetical protein KatS3mg124_1044 [Porticoccaceae bacterium]|nr:MAG: hypothetical protein KatS3mg124_1044 [Porticoccaceae bacterium]
MATASFFLFHFGAFTGVHGVFVDALFPLVPERFALDELTLPFVFVFPEICARITVHLLGQAPPLLLSGVALLFASHGISFLVHYLLRGEAAAARPGAEMMAPYGRVVVLHAVVLGGGFLAAARGSPAAVLWLLAILKTLLDLGLHLRFHRAGAAPPAATAARAGDRGRRSSGSAPRRPSGKGR